MSNGFFMHVRNGLDNITNIIYSLADAKTADLI